MFCWTPSSRRHLAGILSGRRHETHGLVEGALIARPSQQVTADYSKMRLGMLLGVAMTAN